MKRRKLHSRIIEVYDTCGEFASDLGVTRVTLSSWINGHTFPYNRIPQICKLLKIKPEEIGEVFFPEVE